MAERLDEGLVALRSASVWMGEQLQSNPEAALAGATPYLRLFGLAAGGIYLAKGALLAVRENGGADRDHVALARFFAETQVPAAHGLALSITEGADSLLSMPIERLSA
jgi:acyl-CoA dehydrogenase